MFVYNRKKKLLPSKSSLLVAFSGGQDSLTLVKLLHDLKCFYEWKITLIHFDHRWRPDSMLSSKQIFNCAKYYKFPLYYFECPNYLNTEELSRKWRYTTLIDVAIKHSFTKIILAHTATDSAETLLSNLFRGASLDGLSSITWSFQLTKSIYIIRPLLNFYRSETSWFCRKYYLPIWVDRSNYDYNMSRNRLREELVPYIKSYFQPKLEERCYSLSYIIRQDVDFLEQEAFRIYSILVHQELIAINYLILKLLHLSVQSRILKIFFIANLDFYPNSKQINDMIIFINQNKLSCIDMNNYALGIDGIWFYVGIKEES
uniref:tRNA(Ile)-lysidine synthase n=1 Tax=Bangia atropurpurea TaxID=31347 RepID=UPI001FCDA954|nr:tRNA(Ile)-lysidine synthase [Bangia atropurpurea]UNJ18196.1 tRNA(Ile)-lysidine synthase [Bangia atropurpurea]